MLLSFKWRSQLRDRRLHTSLLFLLVYDADASCSCLDDPRLNYNHSQFQTIRPVDSNHTASVASDNRELVMTDLVGLSRARSHEAEKPQISLEDHCFPLLPQSRLLRGCLDAASVLPEQGRKGAP